MNRLLSPRVPAPLLTKREVAVLIDKAEAARQIGGNKPVSISFINQLLAKKLLPRVRLSYRVTRIPQEAVSEYIRSRTVNAQAMH